MNWDDLRFVTALARAGSLASAARSLDVDHTTVGRRVASAERALGVRLFTRTPTGLVATADAERLLAPMAQVEQAVLALERHAAAHGDRLAGTVRVTAPETLGAVYLAPRLAAFGAEHPALTVELVPSGAVLDLGRREAEVAVRLVRSRDEGLVARRAGAIAYGLYAAHTYLAKRALKSIGGLARHRVLGGADPRGIEAKWLARLGPDVRATFVSDSSMALLAAARAGAGIAVLPRYLGDGDPALRHLPAPDEPVETVWLFVHRDLRATPRVRATLDVVADAMKNDAALLRGA